MKKKILILLILAILAASTFFLFRGYLLDWYYGFSLKLGHIEENAGNFLVNEIKKQVSTPPPLSSETQNPSSHLTLNGALLQTNLQRQSSGLPSLKLSEKLNESSAAKARDMFANQYFAHVSPGGKGVADLAAEAGYEFIAIGENLAMGNFKDDKDLVDAWMASPGHRENILNPQYQEIGIAVLQGQYQGKTTWMAVQHFGLPLSACPQPDYSLKEQIAGNKEQISLLEQDIKDLESRIESYRPKRGQVYQQMVEQYNSLVSQYNRLVSSTQDLISRYNGQVNSFNVCLSKLQ